MTTTDPPTGPLAGITVIDLTAVVAGPYATMWLADLGAEVVKVEPPAGDTTRQAGHARHPGMGSVYLTLGRGKRSVALDLKQAAGRRAVLELCRRADVVVHNMRPAAIAGLGLGYDQVRAVRPDVVYATLAGFDPDGPYRHRPAYDDMIQGLTGLAAGLATVTGAPAYVPGVVADKTAGLVLALAITAALVHRQRTGQGQEVVVPLFETMAAYHLVEHLWDATFDPPVGRPGYPRVLTPERRPFATTDGWICALPYQDKHFRALFAAVDRPDLAADPRFASIPARLADADAVYRVLGDLLAAGSTAHWLALFESIGVPAVALGDLDDLLADPHLAATGFFGTVDHPTEGRLRQPGPPVRMSATPATPGRPAARLGQHGVEVLRDLGYDRASIEQLIDAGVLVGAEVEPGRPGPDPGPDPAGGATP